MKSGVFCLSKSIDTFVPIGPWIVTPEEIPEPHALAMELRVNGEPRQSSHTSRISVTIPEIISHYSAMGYSAGDIVSTGTVAGVAGFSADAASLYLKPGDVVAGERVNELLGQLFDHSERYRRLHIGHGPSAWATAGHREILDACKAGRRDQAAGLLASHLARTGLEVSEILEPAYRPERLTTAIADAGGEVPRRRAGAR